MRTVVLVSKDSKPDGAESRVPPISCQPVILPDETHFKSHCFDRGLLATLLYVTITDTSIPCNYPSSYPEPDLCTLHSE